MFEKQQKRMENYTKEANGEKTTQVIQPLSNFERSQSPKHPGEKTREGMSQVLGEFRKLSDTDPQKRPAKKNKDPYHYQSYYVAKRPPSAADFVCVDDFPEAVVSDSNNSTTSSLTSYDKGSLTSSGKQTEEVEGDEEVFESRPLVPPKLPPKIAPKPKLTRRTSSDLTSSSTASVESNNGTLNSRNASELMASKKSICTGNQQETTLNGQSTTVISKAKCGRPTWSPGQPLPKPPAFDDLPPPPTYQEVTEQTAQLSEPQFRTLNSNNSYQIYNPSNEKATTSVLEMENDTPTINVLSVASGARSFTCPKPKFTASAPVSKWKPGS